MVGVGLRTGEEYDQVTEKPLKEAKSVVVLWSNKSVESRWARAEAMLADRNKTLLPLLIESFEHPNMFGFGSQSCQTALCLAPQSLDGGRAKAVNTCWTTLAPTLLAKFPPVRSSFLRYENPGA